jgi:multidrug efflux pump
LLALRQLPVASYPAVAPPALAITLNYPGASAQVVEETVVALIEQELNGIENLLYMDSAAEQNIGTMTLTFQAGTNLDLASVETQNRIKRAEAPARGSAPARHHRGQGGAQLPDVHFHVLARQVSLTTSPWAATPPPTCWKASAARPGVGEAILFGTEYSMRLWLKPERLHASA